MESINYPIFTIERVMLEATEYTLVCENVNHLSIPYFLISHVQRLVVTRCGLENSQMIVRKLSFKIMGLSLSLTLSLFLSLTRSYQTSAH